MLHELARGLIAAGLEVSAEELQDIVWLAQRLPVVAPSADDRPIVRPERAPPPGPGPESKDDKPADDEIARIDSRGAAGQPKVAPTALHARTLTGTVSASTLRVPGVASSDCPDDLRRALQPFARRVPSPWRTVLDEEATAEHAADTGVWSPVCRPVRERWFDLAMVIEDSPSMALWSQTLKEFERLLRNQGGFRSVATYRWSDAKGEEVSTLDGRRRLPVARLAERNRPQLVLLVTDGTSSRWRNGAAQTLLCGVGCHAAVSIVHMLPSRAWRHSAVGEPELKVYGERAGDSNARMKALLPWWLDEADVHEAVGVPVVGLDAATLKTWARTMTARGGASVPAVLVARGRAAAPGREGSSAGVGAAERIARYRSMVSREAYDLAVFLSVPDPLTVPVMRLVQRTMLPATGTAELAEFFVGGLLEREDLGSDALEPAYRLAAGVRDELVKSLRFSEEGRINEQLRSVGRFLENAGQSDQSFDAYFPSPGGSQRLTEWSLPFASVSKAVLAGDLVREVETVAAQAPQQVAEEEPAPAPGEDTRRLVYVSYVHDDITTVETFRRALIKRLHEQPVNGFDEDDIYIDYAEQKNESEWRRQTREALEQAAVLVFMVSRRSLNAPACMKDEVAVADAMGIPIVPVLVEDTDWMKRRILGSRAGRYLGEFQALPRSQNGHLRPLTHWEDRSEGIRSVAEELAKALPDLLAKSRERKPPEDVRAELPRRLRALADACMPVSSTDGRPGMQTAVWFGGEVALTVRLQHPDGPSTMPFESIDVWGQFLSLERELGNTNPVIDEWMVHVAGIESNVPDRQMMALVESEPAQKARQPRRIMPLELGGAVPAAGADCDLFYFRGVMGEALVHDTAFVVGEPSSDVLLLRPREGTRTWPLPPEALGAAVIVGNACCGLVVDIGDARGQARVKSSRVLRDAMRAVSVVRLHRGLDDHATWARSDGALGRRLRLDGADLTGVRTKGFNLQGASLQAARFDHAELERTDLDGAQLERARFTEARLKGSTFVGASMEGADFTGAELIEVNFGGAALRKAIFKDARIVDCIWENAELDEGVLDELLAAASRHEKSDTPPRVGITVQPAAAWLSKKLPPEASARWQLVAAGGSWFNGRQSVLLHLSFAQPAIAWLCEQSQSYLARTAEVAANSELHSMLKANRWDGLMLSVGSDDMFEAVCTLATDASGSPVPRAHRLLLTQDEWQGPEHRGAFRYISDEGIGTLEKYLQANVERIVQARDAGPSRGQPIFLHGFPAPIPRPSGLPGGPGPWLQPSFAAYGIPIADHAATAAALMKLLADMLHGIASDTSRCPNVHFFDASGVRLAQAGANFTGMSGDWLTEVHPTPEGSRKIADAWSAQIESVLESTSGVMKP